MYHSGNQMIDPAHLFAKVHLRQGMHVADFGSGRTGQFVFSSAKVVGPTGLVYAVDIMQYILDGIAKRAAMNGLEQVHTVWADLEQTEGIAIPKKSIDVVFLINILVQSKKPEAMLSLAASVAKDKARILVVDWARVGLPFGPSSEHLVDFDMVKQWGRKNGFAVQEDFSAGPYHRGLVLYQHE